MILFEGDDIEELHALLCAQFSPNRFRVLEDRPVAGRVRASYTGELALYEIGYGADVEIEPGELPDFYNVHIPLTGHGTVRLDGRTVQSPNSIAGPGRHLDMRWHGDSNTLILFIPGRVVDDAVRKRLGDVPSSPLKFDAPIGDSGWLSMTRTFAESAASGLLAQSPIAAGHFEQLLVQGLLDTQPHDLSEALNAGDRAALPSALRRAMAFCEEHAAEPVSIADIAVAARTGVRSLQQTFRSRLGTTPLGYLRRVRLDRAHHDLLAIADGTATGTVTDVALRWGFTHFGRFSGLYRDFYGRTPIRTLRGATVHKTNPPGASRG